MSRTSQLFTEAEVLQALHQVIFFLGILCTNLIVGPCKIL